MEQLIERWMLRARWLLLPLYLALLLLMLAIYALVGRELLHLLHTITTATETELVLLILTVLDLVLLANLLLMVAVSSYESFISKIENASEGSRPEWLGKLDSGGVKVKVALSILMISAINLLRLYMMQATGAEMITMAGVHMVFVVSALATAAIDKIGGSGH